MQKLSSQKKIVLFTIALLCIVSLAAGVSAQSDSVSTSISYGDYVNGTISTKAIWNTYTFSGTAGDSTYIRLRTSWEYFAQSKLYAPNGTLIASGYSRYGTELTMILPVTGTYSLLVGDYEGDSTGTYDLYLQRTNNPANPVLISYGDYVNGTISHPALRNTYTFSGTAGDSTYIRLRTSWEYFAQSKLYAPNGTLIASGYSRYGTELTMILPVTGTYSLLVGDYEGDSTGTYDLYLQLLGTNAVTADFSANTTSGNLPLAVQFTDSSSNSPYVWNWNFGDSNYSIVQNPVHIYAGTGTYTVSLNATNSYGSNTTTKMNYITVGSSGAVPVANFLGTPTSGAAPLTVVFTDNSTNTPTSWSWNFGDSSSVNATAKNPIHTYSSPGTYTVALTATNSAGSNTLTRTSYITVSSAIVTPVANFTGTPTSGTAPLTVIFTDSSTNTPTSWIWSFGDGSTSTTKNPSHTYSSAGTYTVLLTATNSAGSNTLSRTNYITVSSAIVTPVANFTGAPTSGTAPLAVQFTDSSTNTPTSWSWSFGDGATSTSKNPTHTYTATGTYTVSLSVSNVAGNDTLVKSGYITAISPSISQNLVAYYPFNGTANDFSGRGHNGIVSGATLTTDRFGNPNNAYLFDGSDDYIEVPDDADLKPAAVTVGAWVNITSFTSRLCGGNTGVQYIVFKPNSLAYSGNYEGYTLYFAGIIPGQESIDEYFGSYARAPYGHSASALGPANFIQLNRWYFVTLTADSNYISTYIDGVLYDTKPTGFALDYGPQSLYMGRNGNPTCSNWESWYNGTIDDVVLYNRVLNSTEVQTLYISGAPAILPVANFTGSPTYGTAPLTVTFTDSSTNTPTSWSWNFGDGSSSTLQNPSHIYSSAGTYTVALTATNSAGSDTMTRANYITVTDVPPTSSSKIGIFRSGSFFLASSNINGGGTVNAFGYGLADDMPVAGDWNGSGTTTVGIYRTDPYRGAFFLASSNTPGGGAVNAFTYGQEGDVPIAGDWDGDGTDTVGIFRSGSFFLASSNSNGGGTVNAFTFGQAGDVPVAGDWEGSGTTRVGLFRNGAFYLASSNTPGGGTVNAFGYGQAGDMPVVGDWNADGTTEVGIYRTDPYRGAFFLASSNTPGGGAVNAFTYGMEGDVPVAGMWA